MEIPPLSSEKPEIKAERPGKGPQGWRLSLVWSESLRAERSLGKSTGKGRKSGREMERERLLSQGCVQGESSD